MPRPTNNPPSSAFIRYPFFLFLFALLGSAAVLDEHVAANITIDRYPSGNEETPPRAAVIVLYGSGGLRAAGFPYVQLARQFARNGRVVYLPHYLEVTHDNSRNPQSHYKVWAASVVETMRYIKARTSILPGRIVIVGYSLGASVALVTGALEPSLAGVVAWNGSLPDAYREVAALPPLLILHGGKDQVIPEFNARQLSALCALKHFSCRTKLFPEEGHAFSPAGITEAERQISAFLDGVLEPPK